MKRAFTRWMKDDAVGKRVEEETKKIVIDVKMSIITGTECVKTYKGNVTGRDTGDGDMKDAIVAREGVRLDKIEQCWWQ